MIPGLVRLALAFQDDLDRPVVGEIEPLEVGVPTGERGGTQKGHPSTVVPFGRR
jgi:hypothetical protein